MSERPGFAFRGRQISPATRADWRHDARPTNHDSARVAVLNRRIIELLDALYGAEASLAQAWQDGYNHAKVEMLSAEIGEPTEQRAARMRDEARSEAWDEGAYAARKYEGILINPYRAALAPECATCSGRGVWMDEPCSDCERGASDA